MFWRGGSYLTLVFKFKTIFSQYFCQTVPIRHCVFLKFDFPLGKDLFPSTALICGEFRKNISSETLQAHGVSWPVLVLMMLLIISIKSFLFFMWLDDSSTLIKFYHGEHCPAFFFLLIILYYLYSFSSPCKQSLVFTSSLLKKKKCWSIFMMLC